MSKYRMVEQDEIIESTDEWAHIKENKYYQMDNGAALCAGRKPPEFPNHKFRTKRASLNEREIEMINHEAAWRLA